MRDFHKLKVWEKAHQLTLRVYQITCNFPKDELFGLTSQMRRSAASIPTNIADGGWRNSKAETIQFFNVAMGSSVNWSISSFSLMISNTLKKTHTLSFLLNS